MAEEFTLEERANLGENEALRRRSDLRNVAILKWYARGFAIVGLIELAISPSKTRWMFAVPAASITAILAIATVMIFRAQGRGQPVPRFARPLARLLESHPRSTVLAWLSIQYLMVVVYSAPGGSFIWFMLFPYLVVPFRFLSSETVLLFAYLSGIALAAGVTGVTKAPEPGETFGPPLASSGFAMFLTLVSSRRQRKEFVRNWRQGQDDAREQLRMRQELELAKEVQLSMLPRHAPATSWIDVASMSLPANEVGGDYYDYFELDENRLVVVAGDVAGHGLSSGLVLSGVRSGLTLLSEDLGEPARVMQRMQRMLSRTTNRRMLVTLSIVLVDRGERRVVLTSAGHPPMLLRNASTGEVREVSTPSLPLGGAIEREYTQISSPLETGDVLVLHTDGVYESANPRGEPYGMDRLRQSIGAGSPDESANAIRDRLLRDLWEFREGAAQQDDITLVVLRVGSLEDPENSEFRIQDGE